MNNRRVLKCNMFCDNNSIHHIFVNLFQTISYQEIGGNITLNYHGIPMMAFIILTPFTHHNLIFLIHYSMKYEYFSMTLVVRKYWPMFPNISPNISHHGTSDDLPYWFPIWKKKDGSSVSSGWFLSLPPPLSPPLPHPPPLSLTRRAPVSHLYAFEEICSSGGGTTYIVASWWS